MLNDAKLVFVILFFSFLIIIINTLVWSAQVFTSIIFICSWVNTQIFWVFDLTTVWGWERVHNIFCTQQFISPGTKNLNLLYLSPITLPQSLFCNKLAFRFDFFSLEKPQSLKDFFSPQIRIVPVQFLIFVKTDFYPRNENSATQNWNILLTQFSSASLTSTLNEIWEFLTHIYCINWLQKSWKSA